MQGGGKKKYTLEWVFRKKKNARKCKGEYGGIEKSAIQVKIVI